MTEHMGVIAGNARHKLWSRAGEASCSCLWEGEWDKAAAGLHQQRAKCLSSAWYWLMRAKSQAGASRV